MTRAPGLFPIESPTWADSGGLMRAATATIEALRAQNAIQPWHELDCMIVLELSQAVAESKGIAKSQMFAALLAARAKLPEPIVIESDEELIAYEADRELEWVRVHEPPADSADIQDAEIVG